jgi:hypothetical protein
MRPSTLFRGLAAAALSLAFVATPARVAAHENWWEKEIGRTECESTAIEVTNFVYSADDEGFLSDGGLLFAFALHEGVSIVDGAIVDADGTVTPIPTSVLFDDCVIELVDDQIAVAIVGAERGLPGVDVPGSPEAVDCPAPNVDPATGLITIPEGAPADCMYPTAAIPGGDGTSADPCAPDENGIVPELCQSVMPIAEPIDAPVVDATAGSGSGPTELISPLSALIVAVGVGLFAYLRRRRA